ncbi:MAG TPA: exodeoxyribonuclease VII large subunit [Methyloceanibacter sp.]|nr:exodeoxyribonuclease VII large subunit [Methyloceanibacter sp.]
MEQSTEAAAPGNLVEYSVSELASALKRTVEDAFGLVRLRGEISGFKGQHTSGHCYFTLKDDRAAIEAVIWRSTYQRLKFKPEAGLEVVVRGRVTTYPDKSKYQIVIDQLEPAGAGALMALLEQRKKMLAAEGLFLEARKKKLPYLPRVIGVVTSPTGAVIRDILHRLADRFPCHVLVWPVRVQGETCALEVSAAIVGFNALDGGLMPRPDLIIVARGGGSLEDLWAFNEESVARAAAACAIPLISAVGHETDWTIIDLVADYRAPTPTAAAERAVPVRSDLLIAVTQHGVRVATSLRRRIEVERNRFNGLARRGLPRKANILDLPRQRFDSASTNLKRALIANARVHRNWLERSAGRLNAHVLIRAAQNCRDKLGRLDRAATRAERALLVRARAKLDGQAKLLETLSYQNVLARGFALVRSADGAMIRRAAEVEAGAALDIEFADAHISAHADANPRKVEGKPAPRSRRRDEKQGRLL